MNEKKVSTRQIKKWLKNCKITKLNKNDLYVINLTLDSEKISVQNSYTIITHIQDWFKEQGIKMFLVVDTVDNPIPMVIQQSDLSMYNLISKQDANGDTYWTAYFSTMPECVGGGDTPGEAIEELHSNIKVYLDYIKSKE